MVARQDITTCANPGGDALAWRISDAPVGYLKAVAEMESRVAAIRAGDAAEQIWLLEHPPLYTAGTSAKPADLLAAERFPVFQSSRGGQYTYHGPGQRIAYVMLDLKRRANGDGPDLKRLVRGLERCLIDTLAEFGVVGERRPDRVGVWVDIGGGREAKIAALGIRVRRWVTFHGVSLNVDPDLSHFEGIVPCGVSEHGVTSLHALGVPATIAEADEALRRNFEREFGQG